MNRRKFIKTAVITGAGIGFTGSLFSSELSAGSPKVILVKDHASDWFINRSSKKAEVRFAASELQKYIAQISGAELPVEEGTTQSSAVLIGLREDFSEEHTALLPPQEEGYDGYSVAVAEDRELVIIAGDNAPGVIYGVYDFLEQLGCRWFYPTEDENDPEVVPELHTVSVAAGGRSMASPIQYRICNGSGWFFEMEAGEANRQTDWAMKNRYNMMGWQCDHKSSLEEQYAKLEDEGVLAELEQRGMTIHGPAHAFHLLLSHEDYMDDHPEWFGMRDGERVPQTFQGAQFCWSNQAARAKLIENAEAFVKEAPLIRIFCPIPFDGGQACECDECTREGASNLLMVISGEMIESFKTSHPGVQVETIGGYGPVSGPPENLDIIHPEQRIIWAQWGRHHGVGYDDPEYDDENLESWRKAAKGGLTICQYYTDNFAEPWIMGPFATAIESDRQYFLKHEDVDALYMLMYPKGYWWNHSLNGYLGGRSFYDVSLDPFAEVRDYAMHYFGEGAGPYLADYYTQWAEEIELSYRVKDHSLPEDREMLADQRRKWIDPAVEAAASDNVYAYRVGKVEKLHALAEHLAESHRLRDVIQLLRKKGQFKKAAKVLEKARVQTDEVVDMFYTLADLNQGLIERKEIPGFIKKGVKDWIEEEAERIAEKDRTIQDAPEQLDETEMLPSDVTN